VVTVLKVEYDPGDKRSYGEVEISANTPYGLFEFTALIASDSSLEDDTVLLDGEDLTGLGLDLPDLGFPHYLASDALRRRVNEQEQAKDFVEEWCKVYAKHLAVDPTF